MNIIVAGPPGVGKGTQAKILSEKFNLLHISTGDALREEMTLGTPLGVSITDLMNKGQYASDNITNEIVKKKLSQANSYSGYILDGYPRTSAQTSYLNSITKVDYVLLFEASDSTVTKRVIGRAATDKRGDSSADVIQNRIRTYYDTVPAALRAYEKLGIVHVISAEGNIASINKDVIDILR